MRNISVPSPRAEVGARPCRFWSAGGSFAQSFRAATSSDGRKIVSGGKRDSIQLRCVRIIVLSSRVRNTSHLLQTACVMCSASRCSRPRSLSSLRIAYELMDSGKIFLANLSQGEIQEENSALLGSLLVSQL